jgi:solute carrier family 25 protein 33/36
MISQQLFGGQDTALVHLLAAATAGIVISTATNPIWLVKTRLQLDRSGSAIEKTGRRSQDFIAD